MKITQDLTNALSGSNGLDLRPEGKPLDIPVSDIQENPNNPRTDFEPVALHELADDIKVNRVISPVSVFKSADGADKPYTLNYGARRLKASVMAKQATIPAFVTAELDAYQRVAENEQREGLAPMELALFIQGRIDDHGETQVQIAKLLSKTESYVSEQLKLLTLAEPVKAAFESGQIEAPRAAVELSNHMGKLTPVGQQRVKDELKTGKPVTRDKVADLKKATIKNVKTTAKKPTSSSGRRSAKKGAAKTQTITAAELKSIRQLRPVISIWIKRKHGRIAYNVATGNDSHAWVLFDKQNDVIEQVKYTDLELRHVENNAPQTAEPIT